MPRAGQSVSLTEFRVLLRDENFIDYFNKFASLPAFGQLVTYVKDSQEFLLDPSLPSDQYVLNRNGLLEWLWRKRFSYFVRCRLYSEYHLARNLINHDFMKDDSRRFKDCDKRVLNEALHWILRKCFGRVSAMRRFRMFLRKTDQGYKLYQFWLDTERLRLQIKRRSRTSMEIFNQIKETYFSGSGVLSIPQHLLDAGWRHMPASHQKASGDNDRRSYDCSFSMMMQKMCLDQLCNYWVPRYVVVATITVNDMQDEAYYSLAMQYIRFRMTACTTSYGLGDSNDEQSDFDARFGQNQIPGIDIVTPEGDVNTVIQTPAAAKRKRKTKVSFELHAPPGASSSNEDEETNGLESKDTEKPKRRRSKRKKWRGRRGPRSPKSRRSPVQENQENIETRPESPRPTPEEDDSDECESADDDDEGDRSGSSEDSVGSSESWEGVHDKYRKGSKDEKSFKFKERHRHRSQVARKQRFEQLLQTATNRRTSVTASDPQAKVKTKGRRKSEQTVIDNALVDDIELGGTWETSVPSAQEKGSAGPNPLENIGGKALLKAALRMSGPSSPGAENEGFLGTPASMWDAQSDDASSKTSRKNSEASDFSGSRILLSKLSGARKTSRKGSQDSLVSTATAVNLLKKRRPAIRQKPRKTKVTTLTFSLSGEGPTENTKQQAQKDDKPRKREEKKKAPLKIARRKTVFKTIDKMSTLVQQVTKTYTLRDDNDYRSKPENERVIWALQTDHVAANPFRQFLVNTDNDEMVDYLKFWQDVECIRWDYKFGTLTFNSFIAAIRLIVRNYLLPQSPHRIESPPRLRTAIIHEATSPHLHEMPWQMRKLQMEVLEDLKFCFDAYKQQELQSFYNAAAFKTDDVVPSSNPLQWHLPGQANFLSANIHKRIPDAAPLAPRLPERQELQRSSEEDEKRLKVEMKRRMVRAQKLAIEGHLPGGRTLPPPAECERDSGDSDIDGKTRTPSPPKVIIAPPVDMKELASRSIRQYPNGTCTVTNQTRMKVVEKHRQSATLYRPIKRGGHYVRRPLIRPTNFNEILREQAHLEFFKRYLKAYRADTPFIFWIAVEALRNLESQKERQNKARVIIKRYFHNPKVQASKMLQCNADIIREIPYLDVVTTSMLYSAQSAIAKMLEDRWYRKYADTFTDSMFSGPIDDTNETNVKANKMKQGHLKRAWTIFNDFIKRAAMFMRYMREERFVNNFREFLKREIERDDIVRPADDSLQSDVVAKRSNHMPMIDLSKPMGDNTDKERKSKQRIINGQLVTFDLLENDLRFWREIECYKAMSDCHSAKQSIGGYSREDADLLKWKAKLVVNCYLDSSILPAVRVNVPAEVAEITCESLHNGLIDRALFHEATIYVFPLLLTFWKRFCDEHYKYAPVLSKKFRRIYGLKMTPVIAAAMRQEGQGAKNEKGTGKHDENGLAQKKSNRLCTADFPNYLNMDPTKFKKRRGSPHGDEMCPRLTFSVSKGVTLVEPVRGRKYTVMKTASRSPDIRVVLDSGSSGFARRPNPRTTAGTKSGTLPRVNQRRTGLVDVSVLEQFAKMNNN